MSKTAQKPTVPYQFLGIISGLMSKKSRRPSKPLYHPIYWPIWLGVGLLWFVVQLPHTWRLGVGRLLGRLGMRFSSKAREVTEINLRLCFPDVSPKQRQVMAKKCFESLGMGLIEAAMAWWLPRKRLEKLFEIEGLEYYDEYVKANRKVIFLGIHLAPMELAGRFISFRFPFNAMYQQTKNPVLNWVILHSRKKIYHKIIPNNNVRAMIAALDSGECVWYAPDQSPSPKRCVFAPLFGVNTATSTTATHLARLTGAVIMPAAYYRKDDYSGYLLKTSAALENFPSGDEVQDAIRINRMIEEMILHKPEQYLWQYKRFKHRPEGEAAFY